MPSMQKSSVEEIRARFDADVERFSNLETGHTAAVDGALCLRLIAQTAAAVTPHARSVLDVGCGAGNYSLRLQQELPFAHVTLLDLSAPMLQRARERVTASGLGCDTLQSDLRDAQFAPASFDIILAGAVLHHLRTDSEWEQCFAKLVGWLRPGGSVWIFDMIAHEIPATEALQRDRYAEYLTAFGGESYAQTVAGYVEKEDTPRPLTYQLDLLRRCGLSAVDVLHKNSVFAAFGGLRPTQSPATASS